MSPTTLPTARRQPQFIVSGRHVLVAILAFFGVVFGVNGVLLWQAIATHSGLVANEPYRKGLNYNDRIAADERQQALGWSASLRVEDGGTIVVSMMDRAEKPVVGLDITGTFGRPTTVRDDRRSRFVERAPGLYVATADLTAGAWLLTLEVWPQASRELPRGEGADGPIYRMKRRLWLKP